MIVTVKTLQQKSFQVEIDPKEKILALKEKIEKEAGHPVANQKLIFSGKILVDEQTIEEYKITEKDFVVVMVSKPKAPAAAAASTAPSATPRPTQQPSAGSLPEQGQPQGAGASVAATPVSQTSTTSTESATPAAFSSGLLTGTELESAVKNMTEMGFPREQVMRAMQASFNNPDRAVEYLMNGIPEHLSAPETRQAGAAQQTATPATQPSSTPTTTGGPINLFEAAAQAAQRSQQAGGGGGGGGDISLLANQPQFQQLRALVRSNPALLEPLLQQIGQANPQLLAMINQNQEEFLRMLGEDNGGEMEEGAEGAPPGSQYVHVTPEERDAIERLCGLGFERGIAIEAFFACDKNEELAANYLLNMGHDDDENWG